MKNNLVFKYLWLLLAVLLVMTGCQNSEPQKDMTVKDLPVIHETEFGGVYIKMTIDEFNALGYEYGDSVRVEFSTGYVLEDIPYYNGYYVDAGQPLLIAYPGYDYIKAAINYGNDLWEDANLKGTRNVTLWQDASLEEHSTASISLNERGKYLDIQKARDIHYYDERERYPSDEVFANFRSFSLGKMKENVFYRSASPCDNQHNRAGYVDALIQQAGVNSILNLADTDVKINGYISRDDFNSPYFLNLYENGKVHAIGLAMNYAGEEFGQKIVQGLVAISHDEGPYLVHCTEGKDRTGFVCMLIEALAGASYQEIADDYMLTYDNYYQINQQSDPEKYQIILEKNLDAMIITVIGDSAVDYKTVNLAPYAEAYVKKGGMTDEQLQAFMARITE